MYELSAGVDQFSIPPVPVSGVDVGVNNERSQQSENTLKFDEESLLIAVGNAQDREAFNRLFNHYAGKVFGLGMKMLRNEALANELVQESMLAVWQKAPLFDLDKGSAQTWIFTLARNRCFDLMRKQKRQPDCISADDIWPLLAGEDTDADPESQNSAAVEAAQIRSLYKQLPVAQRDVIEHVFMQDKTHQEAALALNIPLGTVKSRLRLAICRLRELVGATQ